jgi:hypothetical protein
VTSATRRAGSQKIRNQALPAATASPGPQLTHPQPPRLNSYVDGSPGILSLGEKSFMRAVTEFRNATPISFIDWVDDLAQSLVDRGEFAALSVEMQMHIAGLRRMITKIRAGHD